MNSKIEVLMASVFAIALSSGLMAVSVGMFSVSVPAAKLVVLDAFSQRGGIGINSSDGSFEPFDNVSVYAYLTQGGISLKNHSINFAVQTPYNARIERTTMTNDSGLAQTEVSLLPSEGQTIGTWHVFAEATVENEVVVDTLEFKCESQNARLDVSFERNGVSSISFLPSDVVSLEARLSYRDVSIAGTPVVFDVKTPNGTEFLLQTATTDDFGRANVTFQVPWPSDLSLGIWQAAAASEVFGQALNVTAQSECYLVPQVIDVFTQKGGDGPNMFGGYFMLNESVTLAAEVHDEFGQAVSSLVIGFYVRGPNQTEIAYLVHTTNSSGIAETAFRVPPDAAFVGVFEIYARARYNGIVLLDAVTLTAEQN